MATTIKSTSLDFDAIKNSLKTFLAARMSLQIITSRRQGFIKYPRRTCVYYTLQWFDCKLWSSTNRSLELHQLRSSIVSLAEGVGYIPDSKTSSVGIVRLSTSLAGVANRPSKIQLASGIKFNATVDDITYVFQTQESISADDDGQGFYEFKTSDASNKIKVHEGVAKNKTFLITQQAENAVYIIPDGSMDISTAVVRVYESPTHQQVLQHTRIFLIVQQCENSTIYILKEAPNGNFYELSFGNGISTLGKAPEAGTKVVVSYLRSSGDTAGTAKVFEPQSQITVSGSQYDLTVTTVSNAVGGGDRESLESIRKNAPFQYASQNRMVTAPDYSSLTLRNFSTLIKDIKTFGGEDALEPEFGVVFMSVLFNSDVPDATVTVTKEAIQDLAKQLSVASFDLKFADPEKTFLETRLFFQFNPRLTTLSLNTIQANVQNTVNKYFTDNVGKFGQSFRRSNLLTLVDDVSPAVLSSRAEIFMQRRIEPTLSKIMDHKIRFPGLLRLLMMSSIESRQHNSNLKGCNVYY